MVDISRIPVLSRPLSAGKKFFSAMIKMTEKTITNGIMELVLFIFKSLNIYPEFSQIAHFHFRKIGLQR